MFLVVLTRITENFKSIYALNSAEVFSIFGHVTYPANFNRVNYILWSLGVHIWYIEILSCDRNNMIIDISNDGRPVKLV